MLSIRAHSTTAIHSKTFHSHVLQHTYHGNCLHCHKNGLQTFHFTVPTGMPRGPALFAWVWWNREHESLMNCASVWVNEGSNNGTQPRRLSNSTIQPTAGTRWSNKRQKENRSNRLSGGHKKPTSTLHNYWNIASWERIRHNHRRKHLKYYYIRAVDKPRTLQHHGIFSKECAGQPLDWNSLPTMETGQRPYRIEL
jgi:hypothetical protein